MKNRDLGPYEYMQALQKEYVCCEIRSKIYVYKKDKEKFKELMGKKRDIVHKIASKNSIDTMFNSELEAKRIWDEVVPLFGLPKFIYNINVSEKQLHFPYKGSVVTSSINHVTGVCAKVDFSNNLIVILKPDNDEIEMPSSEMVRVTPEENDEYYYFYPGNYFRVEGHPQAYILKSYDIVNKVGQILLEANNCVTFRQNQMSRIL